MGKENLKYAFYSLYGKLFGWPIFMRINMLMYNLSLRGMGISGSNYIHNGELNFLKKHLKNKVYRSDLVFFDVGCNTGYYSTALNKIFPNASIYMFDPHPIAYSEARNQSNQKMKVFNIGVGNKNYITKLYDRCDGKTTENASLVENVISEIYKQKSKIYNVEVKSLDQIACEQHVDYIDFLKIDVEGGEYDVLQGAKKLLDKHRINIIQFEFNEMNLYSHKTFGDFKKILEGYELYRIMPHGIFNISKLDSRYVEIFSVQNIIAISKKINIGNSSIGSFLNCVGNP